MIQKVNLKENVNAIDGLFLYKRVGTLNNHMLNVLLGISSVDFAKASIHHSFGNEPGAVSAHFKSLQ